MMEAATGYPSVFVVDPTLRDVPFVPPTRRSQKKWQAGQLFLGFLVLLMLSGLAIQAYVLICFRKELDTAMAQVIESDTVREQPMRLLKKLYKGWKITDECPFNGSLLAHSAPQNGVLSPVMLPGVLLSIWDSVLQLVAGQPQHFIDYDAAPPKPLIRRPSAHLTLGPRSTAIIDGVLQWEHQNGFAFLYDMGYKGGSLICNKSGHYYVYSKLNLVYSSCPAKHQKSSLFTHSMYKRTSRYPKEIMLLTNYITYCNWKDSEQWYRNSFLAGVVYLEEEEEVFIKVTDGELLLYKDDTISYFGTFMI